MSGEWIHLGTTDDGQKVYVRPVAACKSLEKHNKTCVERRLDPKHMCRWCQERG